jgi:3-oxoacyl-[acyl-carrier-protein] synthase II
MTAPPRPVSRTAVARSGKIVLSAWSAVSPYGLGRSLFADGVRATREVVGPVDQAMFPGKFDRAGLIPGFSASGALGRKGTRSMDRLTAIAVKTVGLLVEECGPELTEVAERVGLVLGTGSGSVQSIMDFSHDSLAGEKPYDVDPARFPNTVMNKAAAQCAIWHRVRGPNTTVTGDALTGLLALSYAARLYRNGHCDRVLVGAAEEYSVQRAWLAWHAHSPGQARLPLGEGGTMFVLEGRDDARESGRAPLADVLTIRFRSFHEPADRSTALKTCVLSALRDVNARPGDIGSVAPLGTEDETEALAGILAGVGYRLLDSRALIGDTAAAGCGFQLATILSTATGDLKGTLALVTAIDPAGTVGCAILELC